jgi:hypothetical protein
MWLQRNLLHVLYSGQSLEELIVDWACSGLGRGTWLHIKWSHTWPGQVETRCTFAFLVPYRTLMYYCPALSIVTYSKSQIFTLYVLHASPTESWLCSWYSVCIAWFQAYTVYDWLPGIHTVLHDPLTSMTMLLTFTLYCMIPLTWTVYLIRLFTFSLNSMIPPKCTEFVSGSWYSNCIFFLIQSIVYSLWFL